MSNEEMNKKMEFIVEQQAKFAAEIEILREVQATQYGRLSDALISVVGIVGNLVQAQTRTEERINLLAQALISSEGRINQLAQSQERTDERLSAFINVVERYISGNGGLENSA